MGFPSRSSSERRLRKSVDPGDRGSTDETKCPTGRAGFARRSLTFGLKLRRRRTVVLLSEGLSAPVSPKDLANEAEHVVDRDEKLGRAVAGLCAVPSVLNRPEAVLLPARGA
jgi:hypothetical protein